MLRRQGEPVILGHGNRRPQLRRIPFGPPPRELERLLPEDPLSPLAQVDPGLEARQVGEARRGGVPEEAADRQSVLGRDGQEEAQGTGDDRVGQPVTQLGEVLVGDHREDPVLAGLGDEFGELGAGQLVELVDDHRQVRTRASLGVGRA